MVNSPAKLFFDSDIFILHAGSGLLPSLVAASGFELSGARRLSALPHMLRKGRIPKKYSAATIEKASAWCSKIASSSSVPPSELIEQLVRIDDIDAGEAYLFALAAESDSAIATADKRACYALNSSNSEVKTLLKAKIIGLETALQMLLEDLGYSDIVKALTPVREHNRTLRVLLSQGEQTPESIFREGLNSYAADFATKAGELLFRR